MKKIYVLLMALFVLGYFCDADGRNQMTFQKVMEDDDESEDGDDSEYDDDEEDDVPDVPAHKLRMKLLAPLDKNETSLGGMKGRRSSGPSLSGKPVKKAFTRTWNKGTALHWRQDEKKDDANLVVEGPEEKKVDAAPVVVEGPEEKKVDAAPVVVEGPEEKKVDVAPVVVEGPEEKKVDAAPVVVEGPEEKKVDAAPVVKQSNDQKVPPPIMKKEEVQSNTQAPVAVIKKISPPKSVRDRPRIVNIHKKREAVIKKPLSSQKGKFSGKKRFSGQRNITKKPSEKRDTSWKKKTKKWELPPEKPKDDEAKTS